MSDVIPHDLPDLSQDMAPQPVLLSHFEDLRQQDESTKLGMWTFLATEVMFFSGLFMAYILFRWKYYEGFAIASNQLLILAGALNTGVLLVSSLTMALAVDNAKLGRNKQLIGYLLVTMALGTAFLLVKAFEYYTDYREGLFPGLNWNPSEHHVPGEFKRSVEMFFVLYFAMTGLHALHMFIGIATLGVMAFLAYRSKWADGTTVESIGLYWHFVDLVWVFLFPLLYLIDVYHKSGPSG